MVVMIKALRAFAKMLKGCRFTLCFNVENKNRNNNQLYRSRHLAFITFKPAGVQDDVM